MVQKSGGYEAAGSICCAKDAPACQTKVQSFGADLYEQGSKGRSLQMGAHGIILKWGDPIYKLMALEPGAAKNSTHKWACALYCPNKHNFTSEAAIAPGGDRVRDLGSSAISQPAVVGGATKTVEAYAWTDHIFKIVPMAHDIQYVDQSKGAVPFLKTVTITPFGGPPAAHINTSFVGYDSTVDIASQFDVDMDTVHKCKRQEEGKCPDDPHPPHADARLAPFGFSGPLATAEKTSPAAAASTKVAAMSAGERAAAEAAALAAEAEVVAKARAVGGGKLGGPSFAPAYTAVEHSAFKIAQGAQTSTSGDSCCSVEAPQCQVEVQHIAYKVYVDVAGNHSRVEYSDGHSIVDDYATRKQMKINNTGGVDTCVEYCPIPHQIKMSAMYLPNRSVDMGPTKLGNESVEHFQWKDKIFKLITMSTTDFYAKLGGAHGAEPIFRTESLTPFGGPSIGMRNTTWASFTPGTPPAAKFKIAGADTCPESKHCQGPGEASSDSSLFRTHRLVMGQTAAWEQALVGA